MFHPPPLSFYTAFLSLYFSLLSGSGILAQNEHEELFPHHFFCCLFPPFGYMHLGVPYIICALFLFTKGFPPAYLGYPPRM